PRKRHSPNRKNCETSSKGDRPCVPLLFCWHSFDSPLSTVAPKAYDSRLCLANVAIRRASTKRSLCGRATPSEAPSGDGPRWHSESSWHYRWTRGCAALGESPCFV